jgi:hypothetical protein
VIALVDPEPVHESIDYSDVHIVSKICRKSIFFHPSFPRQKIRQVSVEISTLTSPKIRAPNHIIKLLHFALQPSLCNRCNLVQIVEQEISFNSSLYALFLTLIL